MCTIFWICFLLCVLEVLAVRILKSVVTGCFSLSNRRRADLLSRPDSSSIVPASKFLPIVLSSFAYSLTWPTCTCHNGSCRTATIAYLPCIVNCQWPYWNHNTSLPLRARVGRLLHHFFSSTLHTFHPPRFDEFLHLSSQAAGQRIRNILSSNSILKQQTQRTCL